MSSQASATSGMKLNRRFRRPPPEMVVTMTNKRPKRCAPLRGARLSPIGFVVLSCGLFQIISQSNCQMTPPTQQTLATNDELARHSQTQPEADSSDELANLPCNNHRRQQPALNSRSNQQFAMKLQPGGNQHYNPNHYSPAYLRHHNQRQQLGATARQQRQFGQMLIRSANMLEAPQVQPPAAPSHEEFSLSPSTASGGLTSDPNNKQTNTGHNNSLVNETVTTTTTGAGELTSTPQPGPSNTTTERAIPLSTTPMLTTETIGSPVAPQPVATTTTSSVSTASSGTNSQRQQQGRRIEESSTLVVDRHSSSLSEDQASDPKSNAISSLPSSTSIITPLINPAAAQQQQQSSSMIKPIYVLGNPIGDLDYSSTMYSEQLHQAADRQKADLLPASKPTSGSGSTYPQRAEKRLDSGPSTTSTTQQVGSSELLSTPSASHINNYANEHQSERRPTGSEGDRMNGPALVYSGGHLVTGSGQPQQQSLNGTNNSQASAAETGQQSAAGSSGNEQPLPPLTPRLFQGPSGSGGQDSNAAAVQPGSQRRPSLPPPVNQANAASGLRSPLSPSGPLIGQPVANPPPVSSNSLQQPANTNPQQQMANFYQTLPPYAGGAGSGHSFANGQLAGNSLIQPSLLSNKQAFVLASQQQQQQQQLHQATQTADAIASQIQMPISTAQHQHQQPHASITSQKQALGPSRRPLNITRVEHISAECSNDLIRAVIVFNGTFKGMIYSSGYVNDPTCLYVNGTGLTRYEFSIRLNQCGTLGRQELHQPTIPGEARRRDQVMWNTLSIQYNPVIEQEWDEHFRVSCEYGSDFWKTISFNPFNVETSTGSPVVFTINPPQCQMDVLLGHGMGPKIAVDGPVTVGDPLTLLIHMKSEKAGYDILVKNCVAHNGGKQRMQLIDSNGCVVNERFISPFRGTYNDNDLRHVTLYAYLKAFRFTGSPVLYLECEIHMCQSACPPQMCYWRRLSKRSVDNNDFEYTDERSALTNLTTATQADTDLEPTKPVVSEGLSLFKALQVRHEPIEPSRARLRAQQLQEIYAEDDEAQLVCYRHAEVLVFMATTGALLLLVLSVAVTCCLRIRKMTRSGQFKHSRMPPTGQSISPSFSSSTSSPSLDGLSLTRSSFGFTQSSNSCDRNQSLLQQALNEYSPVVFAAPSNGKKQQQLLATANISSTRDTRPHEQNLVSKRYKNDSGTMPTSLANNTIFTLNR